ncbi:MAG: TIGR00266 family protein [Aigarchaeota archaeon]|nr:TIGR00266 family protein [Aigarchaeota archaeon]MDW8093033.1 TIGR00266 family protein [Nitrososphaerota archaeon]
MKYEIKHRPSFALLEVELGPGESIVAEAGAMTYITPNVRVKTRIREGNLAEALGIKLFGGQSFFVNEYVSEVGGGRVALAAAPLGDIARIELRGSEGFIVQKSSYLASSTSIDLDVKWQGFTKGLFGPGVFMIRVRGDGDLFINTFGALEKLSLGTNEGLIVDNYHLVAFSESCSYSVSKFGGLKSTLLGGEGLVVNVRGPGDVYVQTKSPMEFASWVASLLPSQRGSR